MLSGRKSVTPNAVKVAKPSIEIGSDVYLKPGQASRMYYAAGKLSFAGGYGTAASSRDHR